ncbi:MAG: glycosyltransferase family 9 protein [Bacteroidetes bacterium]|nr:glycosyltransferase family 9 protein [Bacteroidota bacterium]
MKKILIIQTAFIGDVILATTLVENLHIAFPDATLDFLLRKGNESLFTSHPIINKLFVFDKKQQKFKNILKIIKEIRVENYDIVINAQRFATSGFITAFSKGKTKIGFNKNPFSFLFTKSIKHEIGKDENTHEVDRNNFLLKDLVEDPIRILKLYPSERDFEKVEDFKTTPYICIAPASIWFTKQFPAEKWIDFLNNIKSEIQVYLIGAKSDFDLCEKIISETHYGAVINLAGNLSLLETAALMRDAKMNFVNDSAPQHIASAMNAPVKAIFCSTIPSFGFGPLSDNSEIIQTDKKLACKPCGLHGFKTCPEKHFECAMSIDINKLLQSIN